MGKSLISIIIFFWSLSIFAIELNDFKKEPKKVESGVNELKKAPKIFENEFSTILDHKMIGFCSTDGKQNYMIQKNFVERLLDKKCIDENFMFTNHDVKQREIYENNFEFYDNCLDEIQIGDDKFRTGKINYEYSFTCKENSKIFNNLLKDVAIEQFVKISNNNKLKSHNDVTHKDHFCNIGFYNNHLNYNTSYVTKYEKRKEKFIYTDFFPNLPFQPTALEIHHYMCLHGLKHDMILIKFYGSGDVLTYEFMDLKSLIKEENIVKFDMILQAFGGGPIFGKPKDTADVRTNEIDCDKQTFKDYNFRTRKFMSFRGNDYVLSKAERDELLKASEEWKKIEREIDIIGNAIDTNQKIMICRIANSQNILEVHDTYTSEYEKIVSKHTRFYKQEFWDVEHKKKADFVNNLVDKNNLANSPATNTGNSNQLYAQQYLNNNSNAKNYYGRVNHFFSDPGMQQAILTLNEAQFYFLKALGEDQAAIAAGMYARNLKQGSALGQDALQKILVQTKEQQLLINRKIQEGYVLSFEAKQTFSNGIPYYTRGIAILTVQGFNSYDIFNVMNSDTNLFVKILSGFSLFLKVKDALVAIPLFLSSTADIFNYASQNDIENTDELRRAKDSLGV